MSRAILGHGEFRYRLVPGWAKLAGAPIRNGHGLVFDRSGYLYLMTDHPGANLMVLDPASGKVVHQKQLDLPGGHGLSIVEERGRQVLYATCTASHRVVKTTLSGELLSEWGWPRESGKYTSADDYRPSWTLHLPGGEFVVLDGYGKDFVIRYEAAGRYAGIFGGNDGGIVHWGPHGGFVDDSDVRRPTLLVAMSDQRHIARWTPDGRKLSETPLPGSDPRMLRPFGNGRDRRWVVGHLGGKWPEDRNAPGYISILDNSLRVMANIGGNRPEYDRKGVLQSMSAAPDTPFRHPHDAIIGPDGSLYVGQFLSGDEPLLKLERV